MNSNQRRSQSLKIYWQNAVARRAQLSNKFRGESNPAKLLTTKKKISKSKRGKHFKHIHPLSEKQRLHLLHLAELKKGKKHSLETRLKISLSCKGKFKGSKNPFYGKSHTKAVVEKIKKTHQFCRDKHLQNILKKAGKLGFNFKTSYGDKEPKDSLSRNTEVDSLGYIIGTIPTDAYFDILPNRNKFRYAISAKDKDFIEMVVRCLNDFQIRKKIRRQGNLWRIQTNKKQILQFIAYIRKEDSKQWVFAKDVFSADYNFRKSLLMAVCDAEGCVTNSHSKGIVVSRRITVTNSSLLLLKQIKSLFELFGISSYIYLHRNPRTAEIRGKICQFKKYVFTLVITGYQNLRKFKDIIGFSIKRKQQRLNNILNSYKKIERTYNQEEYKLVLGLSKHFTNCCDISKLANIPSHTIRNWVLYNKKPRSIKMVQSI